MFVMSFHLQNMLVLLIGLENVELWKLSTHPDVSTVFWGLEEEEEADVL